ncbi:MAG: DUF169 domain-containing protein [Actinomycetota bacterium]
MRRETSTGWDWGLLAQDLVETLKPTAAPIAISFVNERPDSLARFDAPMAEPLEDGRTGRVPAGCVFWMHSTDRTFSTVEQDHGNCSVGSVTHGFKTWADVGNNSDVATVLQVGWVTPDVIPLIPTITTKPGSVVYGPLAETTIDPDVVLIRLNAKNLMVLSDALPDLRIEGKPQCHIVAVAKESNQVAASVGCMLSRTRTAMPSTDVTCAIPAGRLAEVLDKVMKAAEVDAMVAGYAAEDKRRFMVAG